MKDNKFKQLIIDSFNEYKKENRTHSFVIYGSSYQSRNFIGIIYSASECSSFRSIGNIQYYVDRINPYMLILTSTIDSSECIIDKNELIDYKINDNHIWIKLRHEEVIIKI